MKLYLKNNGLSARQKTIEAKKITLRTLLFFAIVAGLMTLTSCNKKNKAQSVADLKKNSADARDSLNKPQVNIKVNKRFDDKGNMIGFDSTYSSYYSKTKGDTAQMDSLMRSFDRYFNLNHSAFFGNEFKPLFFSDSLRYPDFFHRDYFLKRYELNDQYMRNMMHRMDSIKNKFYYDKTLNDKRKNDKNKQGS